MENAFFLISKTNPKFKNVLVILFKYTIKFCMSRTWLLLVCCTLAVACQEWCLDESDKPQPAGEAPSPWWQLKSTHHCIALWENLGGHTAQNSNNSKEYPFKAPSTATATAKTNFLFWPIMNNNNMRFSS